MLDKAAIDSTLMFSSILIFSLIAGVMAVRIFTFHKERGLVRRRLSNWFSSANAETLTKSGKKLKKRGAGRVELAAGLLKDRPNDADRSLVGKLKQTLAVNLDLAGWGQSFDTFANSSLLLGAAPLVVSVLFDFHIVLALTVGLILSVIPICVLFVRVAMVRLSFTLQLPAAIDLMISVLRSGHSIPQCVKTIADEIPHPCGTEFQAVLQRMNLGQPLSDALTASCTKFGSYELDLIRRAISIQVEIGGSLAELLEKTNQTLKERIKLKQQVKILTAQSRLTAIIVGLLPLVMAFALNALSPGYLNPLFETEFGRSLLLVSIVLQITGIVIMRKLATVKV